jgi:hypothetical protein
MTETIITAENSHFYQNLSFSEGINRFRLADRTFF